MPSPLDRLSELLHYRGAWDGVVEARALLSEVRAEQERLVNELLDKKTECGAYKIEAAALAGDRERLREVLVRTLADIGRAQLVLETLVTREGVGHDAAQRIPTAQIILMGAQGDLRTKELLAATAPSQESPTSVPPPPQES